MIRPGQLYPNEFEVEILKWIFTERSLKFENLNEISVLSREYTGVGGFTNFNCPASDSESVGKERMIGLNALIVMPNTKYGLGAELTLIGNCPKMLEIYSYGEDYWDGVFEGFKIIPNVEPKK